jgi:hypothetical protein
MASQSDVGAELEIEGGNAAQKEGPVDSAESKKKGQSGKIAQRKGGHAGQGAHALSSGGATKEGWAKRGKGKEGSTATKKKTSKPHPAKPAFVLFRESLGAISPELVDGAKVAWGNADDDTKSHWTTLAQAAKAQYKADLAEWKAQQPATAEPTREEVDDGTIVAKKKDRGGAKKKASNKTKKGGKSRW